MKKLVFIFLLSLSNIYAQQAELALSKKIEKYEYSQEELSELNNVGQADVVFRDKLFTKIQTAFQNTLLQHIGFLGTNADIRFVPEYSVLTTNFIVKTSIGILRDELDTNTNNPDVTLDDGTHVHGVYVINIAFKIIDPSSMKILYIIPYKFKLKSSGHESAESVFDYFWHEFVNNGLSKLKADKIAPIIKQKITYSNAKIRYKGVRKADGKTEGTIVISNILPAVLGEAINNSITKFRLTCKKGIFTETNSQFIEFTGADYFHKKRGGERKIEVKYQTYDCTQYNSDENTYDIFTLTQEQELSTINKIKIKEEQITFACEAKYDVFVHYNAPNFVDVKLVWENVEVKFPKNSKDVQTLDISGMKEYEPMSEIKGTDGKPLKLPYKITVPGMGLQIFYGLPENEYSTPNVMSIKRLGTALGTFNQFYIEQEEDALNDFMIHQLNEDDILLHFSFDLFGRIQETGIMQLTVATVEPEVMYGLGTHMTDAYPINFKPIRLDAVQIEQLSNGQELKVHRSTSSPNGNSTVVIEFKPRL